MDIAKLAMTRYTTKAYDQHKRIGTAQLEQLKTLLRYCPSSVNSQPWHFVIAESSEAKTKIAMSTTGPYGANGPKVLNASHVVVLCSLIELDDAHLEQVLEQEEMDGRFPTEDGKAAQMQGRGFYVGMHRNKLHDTKQWMEKQVYLSLGALLFGAAAMKIDATPIEGFDRVALDNALNLGERGLASVVLVALGYRGEDDFNAELPKSRLAEEKVFTLI